MKSSSVETNGGSSLEFLFHQLCLHLPDVLAMDWRWIGLKYGWRNRPPMRLVRDPYNILVPFLLTQMPDVLVMDWGWIGNRLADW